MTEKPYSECSPELPASDGVASQQATETPPGQHTADPKTRKLSLNKIGLIKLAIATGLLALIAFLLKESDAMPWIANIAASLALTAVCLLIFRLATERYIREFLTVILAMWLPLGVTVAAGVLLFYEEQGRDLGVGLLGEGHLKLFMLFLILIYWAVNNWHSARIGLDYAFPSPSGTESWLFWSPRLLGVCAHFFAAMSLALASWGLSPAVDGSPSIFERSDLLVFTAPAAVLLVTFAAWAIDVTFFSKRPKKPLRPRTAKWITTISVVLVIVFLLGLWRYNDSLPEGLFPGTLWISASALVFLIIISWLRGPFAPQPVIHHAFTIVLALIAFVVGGLIWWPSLHVGDFLGSLNVCLFAFGAVLAIMNGLGLFASLFIDRSVRAERVKFAVLSLTFLLLLAAFTSPLRHFHRVRSCDTAAGRSRMRSSTGSRTGRRTPLPHTASRRAIA